MDHTGSLAGLETILQQTADLSQEKHLIPELQLLSAQKPLRLTSARSCLTVKNKAGTATHPDVARGLKKANQQLKIEQRLFPLKTKQKSSEIRSIRGDVSELEEKAEAVSCALMNLAH